MNSFTLKILGIIQMVFSAAIFIVLGESETLNLSDGENFSFGVYNDSELGGNSIIKQTEKNNFDIAVGDAYEHAFAGVYIEQKGGKLFDLGASKEISLDVISDNEATFIVTFEKYIPGEDFTRPFQHGTGLKLNKDSKNVKLLLADFNTPDWWLENHPKSNKTEVVGDSIVSFNLELKKLGGKSQSAVVELSQISLTSGQNNLVLPIGGGLLIVGLALMFMPSKKGAAQSVPKDENPIIYYINSNLTSRSLTINSVSEHFKLSTDYINDRVKTETGLSYKDFVNQRRIEKAKELLKTTDEKAFEVAQLCGFNSSASFSQTFKSVTGATPNDYRKSKD